MQYTSKHTLLKRPLIYPTNDLETPVKYILNTFETQGRVLETPNKIPRDILETPLNHLGKNLEKGANENLSESM